jgi:ribose 5-phosphate isomerase RpiB
MGIAMVIPAEKIQGALAGYANQEEIEANDFRERKANVISVGDATPQPNVTVGTATFTSDQKE